MNLLTVAARSIRCIATRKDTVFRWSTPLTFLNSFEISQIFERPHNPQGLALRQTKFISYLSAATPDNTRRTTPFSQPTQYEALVSSHRLKILGALFFAIPNYSTQDVPSHALKK